MAEVTFSPPPSALAIASANSQAHAETSLSPEQLRRIDDTAKEFEALVLSQLLAPLFSSVDHPEIAGGNGQSDAFQTLLQEEYAQAIATRGGLGIADQVKASLINLQANQ